MRIVDLSHDTAFQLAAIQASGKLIVALEDLRFTTRREQSTRDLLAIRKLRADAEEELTTEEITD